MERLREETIKEYTKLRDEIMVSMPEEDKKKLTKRIESIEKDSVNS